MEEDIIDTTDRISELPEFIVNHILSFLDSPVNLVRMSVLSKKWFDLTASFPILDFDINKIYKAIYATHLYFTDDDYVRETLLKYAAYTASRFCKQNVSAHTLNVIMVLQEPADEEIIDILMELILRKDVKVLVIDIFTTGKHFSAKPIPMYCVPNICLSASSLTSLTIHHCALPNYLMVDDVKFKSLKRLELEDVFIDDDMIKRLATICPLLEEFHVQFCSGVEEFCVYEHQNLQKVFIHYMSGVERIDIKAPNLCYLSLTDLGRIKAPYLNLASCKKLTTLSYREYPSPSFADFSSNFPFLETLFLGLPYRFNNLKMSSYSLRKFVLLSMCDLDKIDINAPNLVLFEYNGRSHMPYSAELKTAMECYLEDNDDTLWFQKLRRFLDMKIGFKVLKLHIVTYRINVDQLEVTSPPYELEHVDLDLYTVPKLLVCVAAVDAVLWCCRPQSLTLTLNFRFSDFKLRSLVVMYTYEKLLQQEDEDRTNIQIVLSSSPKAKVKKHFSNLISFLIASPRDQQGLVITFIKEQEPKVCRFGDFMMH